MWSSRFFTLEEFCYSNTAVIYDLDNTLPSCYLANANIFCCLVLDFLRFRLGRPLVISSGYRSDAVNAAVHGAVNSLHLKGLAADIPFSVNGLDVSFFDCLSFYNGVISFEKIVHNTDYIHIGIKSILLK